MSDLIDENPRLLLLMDHFGLDPVVYDRSVALLCGEKRISAKVFVLFANLYNGYKPAGNEKFSAADLDSILLFLRSSHQYYKQEKYPEIRSLIVQLYALNPAPEIRLVEQFFDEYFGEVTEHLNYEDTVVYPYFSRYREGDAALTDAGGTFSATEYRNHHSDIESKLADLKNLLLKHIPAGNDRAGRRRLLMSLFELEFDLRIHSLIEDTVLIPLIDRIENETGHE
jgi:regulator of cell morphogenesis and NO signaling